MVAFTGPARYAVRIIGTSAIVSDTSAATLEHILRQYWGFDRFRPLQREAIEAILDRRDSLVVMPTGGGKSVCFQAPALVGDDGGWPSSCRRSSR